MACSRSLNREVQAHNDAHHPRRSSVGHPHVSKNENDDRTAVSRAAVLACSDVPGGSAIALTVCPAHCVRTTTARCVAVIRPATLYLLVTQAA